MVASRWKAGAGLSLAAVVLFFSNVARPRTMQVAFGAPQVCDCGVICAEHRTCKIPMCTGDFFKDSVEQVAKVKRPTKYVADPQTDELEAQSGVSAATDEAAETQ